MNHLFNLLTVFLIVLNLLGLSLWVRRLSQLPLGLAIPVTAVGATLLLFSLEHFVGLGPLGWALPLTTMGASWGIWKNLGDIRKSSGAVVVFLAGFAYALLWRYTFPDLDFSCSEKQTDLNFVASYLAAGQVFGPAGALPASELWLHGYSFDEYYGFQHYAAALLGRIFSLSAGAATNLSFCVATGLVLASAYEWLRNFTARPTRLTLILAALLLGGTGACLVTPFTLKSDSPFASMRYIGGTNVTPDSGLTPLGIWLRDTQYGPLSPAQLEAVLDLPDEIFSYIVFLGDYHPPLGGYVLLASAMAAFGVLLGRPEAVPRRWATGILAGSVPLAIATNTWVFPLQALLAAVCFTFLWCYRDRPRWGEFFITAILPWVLMYPWLANFLRYPGGGSMKLASVPWDMHTPALSYFLQMWPILGLLLLAWFGLSAWGREYRWLVVAVALGLVGSEWLHIDETFGGKFERFNTTLKWWPWLGAAALLFFSAVNLADANRSRLVRIGTICILSATLVHVIALGREWKSRPKPSFGQLDGAAWLRQVGQDPQDPTKLSVNASILNYLQARPGGVVLEPLIPNRLAYVETGAVSLFTGHPLVLGWGAHEQLWRGYQRDIEQRFNRAFEFFRGDLADPLTFLSQQDVRFILWPAAQDVPAEVFRKIQHQIESHYVFVRFDEAQPLRGIWQRRETINTSTKSPYSL